MTVVAASCLRPRSAPVPRALRPAHYPAVSVECVPSLLRCEMERCQFFTSRPSPRRDLCPHAVRQPQAGRQTHVCAAYSWWPCVCRAVIGRRAVARELHARNALRLPRSRRLSAGRTQYLRRLRRARVPRDVRTRRGRSRTHRRSFSVPSATSPSKRLTTRTIVSRSIRRNGALRSSATQRSPSTSF